MTHDPQASIDQFINQLQQASPRPRTAPQTSPTTEVLQSFCEKLNRLEYVRCAVEPGPVPSLVSLVMHPRFQPKQRSTMLTFRVLENGHAQTVGDHRDPMAPEALWIYLEDFLQHSDFPRTLAYYESLAHDELSGFLKLRWATRTSFEDVAVVVSPDTQRTLGLKSETRDESFISVRVQLIKPYPMGKFYEGGDYRYLESGGLVMRVDHVELEASSHELTVHGHVVPFGQVQSLA